MLQNGDTVAGYRIEGVLGHGGMSVVYEASQLSVRRTVALKILAAGLSDDAQFQQRFAREAQIQAGLDHPNVVPIYEAGESEHGPFIAMRLVRGPTLKELISGGGLDPRRAVGLLAPIADALDAAHEVGLVHRDVKPQNILIAPRDYPYLADFGLTKGFQDRALTQTGTLLGTVDYLAPEQIMGADVTSQSDLYALAVVIYECLTGGAPYQRDTEAAAMFATMSEPPPLVSERRPDLPGALDGVLARGLAKDPHERHASAGALVDEVLTALGPAGGTPASRPAAPPAAMPTPAVRADSDTLRPALPSRPPQPARARPERGRTRLQRRPRGGRVPTAPAPRAPISIPLHPRFEYTSDPLGHDNVIPLLGHDDIVEGLVHRITHSRGGSLLVCGFRGVGKTTVVSRALAELQDAGRRAGIVPVRLNVARPLSGSELLYEVVRALHDELEESGAMERLDPKTRERVELAYARTSRSRKQISSNSVERGRGLGLGASLPGLTTVTSKLDISRKDLESRQSEDVFNEYRDADVEHDFARIVGRLHRGAAPAGDPPRFARFRRRGKAPEAWSGQVVVIVDELDKLTAHPDGAQAVRTLIAGLKNLLTTRGAHFVFVAGTDLYEEALGDRRRGNSVFDSVFGWRVYVPCVWDAEGALLDALIDAEARRAPELQNLRDHLAFWGRGVPRLLLRELDSFVRWDGDTPHLVLDAEAMDRVNVYAGLHRVVKEFVESHEGAGAPEVDVDQWRVGVYYAVEWIFNFKVTFTVEDVVRLSVDASIDPLLALEEQEVRDLLDHLVEHGLLEQVGGLADQPYYGDIAASEVVAYALPDDIAVTLERAAGAAAPPEPTEGVASAPPATEVNFSGALGHELAGGRYRVVEELDRAGAGRVYRAIDLRTGRDVAVKLFDFSGVEGRDVMRARFIREGEIALALEHPHIVRTQATFGLETETTGIVMELVDGVSLARRLEAGALEPRAAVELCERLLDALGYVARNGLARLDLRPSGIVVDERGNPTIVNLGLVKHVDRSDGETRAGVQVGTPAYAAPEQLRGEDVDIRADLYSLALILFELIAGRPARSGDSVAGVIRAALEEPVDLEDLAISDPLRRVMARALERDAHGRFSSPEEMRAALLATPEGGGSGRVG